MASLRRASSVLRSVAACQRRYKHTVTFDAKEGFVRPLFSGRLSEGQVFPYPRVLSQDEEENVKAMLDPCYKFFTQINNPHQNDETSDIPPAVLQQAKDLGAFGIQIPEEFGGSGFSNTGYARLTEMIGNALDLGFGICLGAHQSIGLKGILLYGTPEQKAKYLPKLAVGENVAAFALTEPSSGSDANSIRCRAVLSEDGKHWVLNGSKIWISNGGIAEIFTVFAQTQVTTKSGEKKDKVTAFIVERSFGGLTNGPPEKKMGIKCSNTAEVYFENVKIPVENVLGDVGGGFKVAMGILNNGRFGMGAALSGVMKQMIHVASDFATNRVQFGRKISEFSLIKEKIAQMALRTYAAESMAYLIAANMDRGSDDYHIEAAIGKVFASEAAWFVTDETLQIMGGNGFMRANHVERVLRDLRIFRIFEGTNEILRLFVALSGIQAAGNDLKEIQKALKSPLSNLGSLSGIVGTRAKRMMGMPEDQVHLVHSSLRSSATLLEKNVSAFGGVVESLLMKHGRNVIDKQIQLKRLADCAIDIYSMAAVLSRATRAIEENSPTVESEQLMAETWCKDADSRVRHNIKKIHSSLSGQSTDPDYIKLAEIIYRQNSYPARHPTGIDYIPQ
eukprot:TRINITY_DN1648_c0_g1::TRINITY_DN1648_c0_g1_i1::g.17782::m.17782 TRINITY_DN1648_c0_g1::TRINITY_DN1648_c0_g1_i1::g.17782  ORF type:complete len:619 (-),score=152.42,sp/P48818/ACADV_BOVIN/54.62/0.0,Acyl-CoA_dh_1/PF00441.19/1.1e-39,Acyl-CoA_dh_1/PF00441.19/0.046,Acyl-CoA_dh_M/PF02770.14/5.7e-21,Acyl-CoA_dh_N/PF02771.11/7.1e-21,Acyl-CoA_dh_2/PF08028.6/5.2e-15,Acyl-CoA_dh_2/PF08028.6/0.3,PMEI/PF04043.10/0.44 TRINITY_DN1648_c0_g1_i1:27-1883(-)